MSKCTKPFTPKGRKSLPTELVQFGRHLVYSEGTKTEPYYIEDIKKCISKKYNCNPNEIEIIPVNKNGKSYSTIGLVEYAENDVKKRLKTKEIINHIWIFFDKDEFSQDDFNNAHKIICSKNNSNKKNIDGFNFEKETSITWHSCWSNEAFELWLCLYFNYLEAKMNRKQYIEKINNVPELRKIGFNYEKNLENIHTTLIKHGGSLKNAIKFSKRLNSNNLIYNPSTGVYQFAEFFYKYLEENCR